LLYLLLVDLLNGVSEIVIEVYSEGTDEDDVGPHGEAAAVGQTMPIEKHHFSYVKVFGVVKSVAVEALDEYLLPIVPE